jgi:lipopolysaccharide export LptBFGC system permease protein LptF
MDLGTIVISLVIIIICSAPFVIMSIKNSKKEKRMLQNLVDIAAQKNNRINLHELWNNSIIGMDSINATVFYARNIKDKEISQQINLAEVEKCRVINSSRTLSNKNGNFTIVDKLELGFLFQDKNKNEAKLEFYNTDYDSLTLSSEFQSVQKWCKIFNNKIFELVK